MLPRILIACLAVLFLDAPGAYSASHPDAKKISKWTAKQGKLQVKIDAENARTSPGTVGVISTVQYSAPAVVYRSAPVVRVQVAPPVVVQQAPPAVETEYLPAPPVTEETQIVVPRTIHYYDNNPIPFYRSYSAPPAYRVYRSYRAAPVLGCPIFGGVFGASADGSTWLQRYHARKADEHARKAAAHASKS